ncbi:hypothetical protein [Paenibacillus turpanensis]|uniref:hypothetical protein n=1 Tax=Paenibacillus turpanensis TaxID=2689078 RepID=UPI00313323C8
MEQEQKLDVLFMPAGEIVDDNMREVLKLSVEREEEMMRTYLIAAERVEDEELQERLRNFAEGNAKRSRQLIDELNRFEVLE